MPSRFGATIEQIKTDYASSPEKTGAVNRVRGVAGTTAAKVYDAISGVTSSIIAIPSSKEYVVQQRDGITAATRAAISNTWNAQWVKSGPLRVLNVVPKALTAVTELPDGVIRDGIQIAGGGGKNDGTIIRTAA